MRRDPGVDALLEDVEGQGARVDDLVVEGANVELVSQSLLRAVAEL